jgi:hypothetical protein
MQGNYERCKRRRRRRRRRRRGAGGGAATDMELGAPWTSFHTIANHVLILCN